MNAKLKRKCDKLITHAKNGTLLYSDIINEIAKNKELLRYSTTIPNAMSYIRSNGITIVMPEITETAIAETHNNINESLDSEIIIADDLNEEAMAAIEKDIEMTTEIEPTKDELRKIEAESNNQYYGTDDVKHYLRDISDLHDRLLTAEEEKELAIRYRNGDNDAKRLLIEYNLKLVISVAKQYLYASSTTMLSFNDLIQNGNLGLIKAVDKFDPDYGFRFSTYATHWIRQTITRGLGNEGRTIRMPIYVIEQLRYIYKAIKELQSKSNSENIPEYADIAALCNEKGWVIKPNGNTKTKTITPEKVKKYLQYQNNASMVSLDVPVGQDEDSFLGDFIPDSTQNIEDVIERRDMTEKFEYAFNKYLTPREAGVLRLRFGFNGQERMTLDQVGEIVGLTRERIRQIEDKAKLKLRTKKEIRDLLI